MKTEKIMTMKTRYVMYQLMLTAILSISVSFIVSAQVKINIASQPVWGPAGYNFVNYYYLPDADVYYDVSRKVYVYREGTVWGTHTVLPIRYRNINLYNSHKVVINQPMPWKRHNYYYKQYHGYAGRKGQIAIRDASDSKYWENPGHPQHIKWKKPNNNGNKIKNAGQGNLKKSTGNINKSNSGNGSKKSEGNRGKVKRH